MRPIGIDLFAGAGGLSLGFEQAGFDVAAAIEIDPVHCAVHRFNFPNTTIIPKSVVGLSVQEIREKSGIGDKQVDCVFGGAPCQGFSLIGQRAIDDPRNSLVREFVRIVTDLNSRTFVFENVKGLGLGKHRVFLEELISEFMSSGYEVRTEVAVLNAGHYGTPQSRERLILLGARKGEVVPSYPLPTTNIAGKRFKFKDLPEGPSCYDALGDLPDVDQFDDLRSVDSILYENNASLSSYATGLRCVSNPTWYLGYRRHWNPALLTSSARTGHTDISRRRFLETLPGAVEPISRFFRLPIDGVSNTLRAGTDGSRGAFTSPRPIHYDYHRCITVREMARLHGFPDWFRFNVTKWHGARQIGNAVPPPLSRAIAVEVAKAVGAKVNRPRRLVKLGNDELLSFDRTQASNFFGVDPLPSRRDRKSGAKKRKQVDIERDRLADQVMYG